MGTVEEGPDPASTISIVTDNKGFDIYSLNSPYAASLPNDIKSPLKGKILKSPLGIIIFKNNH